MESNTSRFTLCVPPEMAERAEAIKREEFYNKPYAEMYRKLIDLGMKVFEEQLAATEDQPA